MVEHDKWRHVRAVLAKRTPDSELLVHRHGGEIVAVVGEKMARVMVLRVPEGADQARADADLDALSTLWNVADELLADADALAGARAECQRLRAALATIQQWDCLNPPNTGLCADFPWLRELVDTALTPGTGGVSDGNG